MWIWATATLSRAPSAWVIYHRAVTRFLRAFMMECVYMHVHVCVCVCMEGGRERERVKFLTHTPHT